MNPNEVYVPLASAASQIFMILGGLLENRGVRVFNAAAIALPQFVYGVSTGHQGALFGCLAPALCGIIASANAIHRERHPQAETVAA